MKRAKQSARGKKNKTARSEKPVREPGGRSAFWSSPRVFYGALFGGALLVRAIYLLETAATPMAATPIGDGESYHVWAQAIAGGDWLGDEVFYQAPLYPYFMAVIYAIFGPHLLAVRLVQILLGSASCLLLAATGERIFARTGGRLAGVLLALYPTAIYFDGLIQKTCLAFFLFSIILFLVSRLQQAPKPWLWLACGGVLGLMSINRENALILLPVLFSWLWLAFRNESVRRRSVWCCLLIAGLAVVLFPLTLRNRIVADQWVLTTSNLGINFYIGNNKNANGRYAPLRPGRGDWKFERVDAVELAEEEVGHPLDAAQVSRFWLHKTLDQISADPLRWFSLMGHKILLVWNATEIADTEDIYTYSGWSFVLKTTRFLFHFGILCPLAMVGLFASWRWRSRLWVFYLMGLAYASSVALFFVFDRFRFPLVGVLMPFAAFGLLTLKAAFQSGKWRALAPALLVALVVAVGVNLSLVPRADFAANSNLNLGNILVREGNYAAAIDHYEQSLAAEPERAETHIALGNACLNTGRFAKALTHLNKAAALRPDMAEVPAQLGLVHLVQGNTAQAIRFLTQALNLDPQHAEALNNLAWLLATTADETYRDGPRAVVLAKRVNTLSGEDSADHLDTLAAAHAAAGQFEAAIEAATKAEKSARQAGDDQKAAAIAGRLSDYRKNKAFFR